ncbi:UBIQUITIN_CONJUGAT_2 domain-containing protein [Meloidogyne graminicola]|uniref:Protein FAM50 homolog n=1 Tax=Meloidogyne graminicola TaxID=189291 RepID=A0A8S9ZNM8_9BILA|nr:UBIQUITIN_CONJUGAT_2 domain-containing protein [Meloidogyne graminicola]
MADKKPLTSSPNAVRRLQQELADVNENPIEGFKVTSAGDDLFKWKVALFGAPGTIYQGGYFKATLTFPDKYPFEPPSMRFDSPFYHPNVYKDGRVCISILHAPGHDQMSGETAAERWNPAQGVRSILLSVISMLNEPNISSPANVDASVCYRKYKQEGDTEFTERIKKLIEKSKEEAAKDNVMVPQTEAEYVIRTNVKRQQTEKEDDGTDNGDVGLEVAAGISSKFTTNVDQIEEKFKASTVGLVTLDEKRVLSFKNFDDEDEDSEQSVVIVKKRLGMDPTVDTSFLPDRERDEQIQRERERIGAEWLEMQEREKNEEIMVAFCYWDGSSHRRDFKTKKGTTIAQFLQKALELFRKEFLELKLATVENLMFIKEDLIIPHFYTFQDFIKTKQMGKTGPLWQFESVGEIRVRQDAALDVGESHPVKVVVMFVIAVIFILGSYMLYLGVVEPMVFRQRQTTTTAFIPYSRHTDVDREDVGDLNTFWFLQDSDEASLVASDVMDDLVTAEKNKWKVDVEEQRRNVLGQHSVLN